MSFASKHNDHLDPDIHNPEVFDDEEPTLTPAQKAQITRLRKAIDRARTEAFAAPRTKITVESLFEHCPEGDFDWDGEPEDVGNAWNCGDSDCESGWHQSVQCIEQGREGDKTWFVVREDNFAGDGDYQPVAGWDEREGDEITQDVLDDLWYHLEGRVIEHFAGWAEYCLDVAETGKDPLNNWCFNKQPTPDNAIAAAKDNLKYLRLKPGK